jgi:Tfp pilus assembly protein PilO
MNRNLIASIIFAAGAFAFFVLVLPKFDSISNARTALKTRQSLLEERGAELKKIGELDKKYKARQADINKIIAFMPAQKRIDQIVSSIQQVSSQAGLSLTSITTAGAAETGEITNYKTILVSFEVIGQYPSFMNFLKLLEQNLRLYDIFEVVASLTTTAGGEGQNLVNFAVKLNAYYLQ